MKRKKIIYEQDFSKGPTPDVTDLKWQIETSYILTTEQEWKSQFEVARKKWEESSDCAALEAQMIQLRQANRSIRVTAVVGLGIGSFHRDGLSPSMVNTRI